MIRGGDLPFVRIHGMLRLPRGRVLDHMRLHTRRLQRPRARRPQSAIAHPGAKGR
jgi:hypothetical protein